MKRRIQLTCARSVLKAEMLNEGNGTMTRELSSLIAELNATFFRYAHITGAIEFYTLVLETPALQRAASKVMTGDEIEWKQIHRFMDIGDQRITWYPELPVADVLAQRNGMLGYLYGVTLSHMIGDLDYYLATVLKNHFGHVETSGSSWDRFAQKTTIDLLERQHGEFVYTLLQERHKIEHNKAQVDRKFLDRMARQNVKTTYKEGEPIQKSHIDVLLANQAIREFATDVDAEASKLLTKP